MAQIPNCLKNDQGRGRYSFY